MELYIPYDVVACSCQFESVNVNISVI